MKRMYYLSMILLTAMLSFIGTSCGNDDEGDELSAQEQAVFNTLIGTWRGQGVNSGKEWIFTASKEYSLNEYNTRTNTLTSTESGRFTLTTRSDGGVYIDVGNFLYAITLIDSNSIKIGGDIYNRVGSPVNTDDDDNGNGNGNGNVVVGSIPDVSGNIAGRDYVDIGLSVLWATYNIGASSPEEVGNYYAWGETETKSRYSYNNYRSYKSDSQYGFRITSLISDISGTSYDAATSKWGQSWRMPTRAEMDELDKCAWKWMNYQGTMGCMFTGPNGKSLFLPAGGYYDDDELKEFHQYGKYWSSTRSIADWEPPYDYVWAQALEFGQINKFGIDAAANVPRYFGLNVRAVVNKSSGGGSGDSGDSGDSTGEPPYVTSYTFTATKSSITVKFMCNEKPTSATVKYGTSSPSSTISSSISGKQVTATASGLKSGTKYYFKCTVKNSYGSSTSDTFSAITNY